jgi:hypothetical protein
MMLDALPENRESIGFLAAKSRIRNVKTTDFTDYTDWKRVWLRPLHEFAFGETGKGKDRAFVSSNLCNP